MRAGRARLVAVVCAAAASLAACSGSGDGAPAAGSAPAASASPSAAPGPSGPPAPTPAAAPASAAPASAAPQGVAPSGPPAAAGTPVLVERPGALPPEQRLRAPAVPFDRPAAFPDGVSLQVREIEHGVSDETGIGAVADVATTTLVVEVRNGSPAALDLNGVVVTATSAGARPADPVYGGDQQDLSGVVPSGGRAEGTYSFAIPEDGRGDVTLSMDLDGRHLPAVWRGAVAS